MSESEWRTRKSRIDTKLKGMKPAWKIIPYSSDLSTDTLHQIAVEEFPTSNGPADYALFIKGKLLGIIEAKKVSVSPGNVLEQAKRYSEGVAQPVPHYGSGASSTQFSKYKAPFIYSTNGEVIWFADVRDPKFLSRELSRFHSPDALEEMWNTNRTQAALDLVGNPVEFPRLRPYQRDAITAVENSLSGGRRNMLVAMATGTGKTFTTVSLCYRLLASKYARRILFLVDRRALAAQSSLAFHTFDTPRGNKFNQEYEIYSQRFRREDLEDEEDSKKAAFDPQVLPEEYLTQPQAKHTFVYVSTIQRMAINLFGREGAFSQGASDPDYEDDVDKLDIPIHAFDVIIADECHRGYTAQEEGIWRKVLNHFDAVKIGLTATPAKHTLSLFEEVVYEYSTEQAIADGYLVDYEAVAISSGVRMNGVFLKEGEEVEFVDTGKGTKQYHLLEDEREFDASKIERDITAPDSNEKIIKEVAKYAHEHNEKFGRFPKILIFAANDLQHTSHADQLVRISRKVFNQGDDFVKKITGNANVDRPLKRIREFRNRPNPKVVVTVDMLTTGVDIPSLEFIVFMRPVKSRILWVQMLGRGTRLCKDLTPSKTHFTIFDCFDGSLIDYFRDVTDFEIPRPEVQSVETKQVIENIYQNVDREYFSKVLVKRLRRIERDMSGDAYQQFSKFIPNGDIGAFASELQRRLKDDFTGTMRVLRDPGFQEELTSYKRAIRTFIVAPGVEDTVTSRKLFKVGDKTLKPKDYLVAFRRFVVETKNEIEALQIVLERPKNWSVKALSELREKLTLGGFPEPELQKAHEIVNHKALADIISIVKKGVEEDRPLLTAEERVRSVMATLRSESVIFNGRFTDDQSKWLQYIEEHLVRNLSLSEEDFNEIPVLADHGGLRKAQKVFGVQLSSLIEEINFKLAA
jgi:type I restriction enzyme R subunit